MAQAYFGDHGVYSQRRYAAAQRAAMSHDVPAAFAHLVGNMDNERDNVSPIGQLAAQRRQEQRAADAAADADALEGMSAAARVALAKYQAKVVKYKALYVKYKVKWDKQKLRKLRCERRNETAASTTVDSADSTSAVASATSAAAVERDAPSSDTASSSPSVSPSSSSSSASSSAAAARKATRPTIVTTPKGKACVAGASATPKDTATSPVADVPAAATVTATVPNDAALPPPPEPRFVFITGTTVAFETHLSASSLSQAVLDVVTARSRLLDEHDTNDAVQKLIVSDGNADGRIVGIVLNDTDAATLETGDVARLRALIDAAKQMGKSRRVPRSTVCTMLAHLIPPHNAAVGDIVTMSSLDDNSGSVEFTKRLGDKATRLYFV